MGLSGIKENKEVGVSSENNSHINGTVRMEVGIAVEQPNKYSVGIK
jgi:hypothetical protein